MYYDIYYVRQVCNLPTYYSLFVVDCHVHAVINLRAHTYINIRTYLLYLTECIQSITATSSEMQSTTNVITTITTAIIHTTTNTTTATTSSSVSVPTPTTVQTTSSQNSTGL